MVSKLSSVQTENLSWVETKKLFSVETEKLFQMNLSNALWGVLAWLNTGLKSPPPTKLRSKMWGFGHERAPEVSPPEPAT